MDWLDDTRVKKIPADAVTIDGRELAARLKDTSGEMPTNIYKSLLSAASCCYSGLICSALVSGDLVRIGDTVIHSRDLAHALDGCDRVLLLVATLGFSVDRYINGLGVSSVCEQFYADCLADALIEGLCDCAELDAIKAGLSLTNRFSPGYGDLELSVGQQVVAMLGADKSLGIRYTESGLALPKKTVTAFIGVR